MARSVRDEAGTRDWLGYHDNMFPEDTENGQDWSFLATIRRSGRTANWQRAPVGGEMVPGVAQKWLDNPQTRTLIARSHFFWVGPYCPALANLAAGSDQERKAQELVRQMGYQCRWTEFKIPDRIMIGKSTAIELTGMNEGVAPFYKDWALEFALLAHSGAPVVRSKSSVDLRTWLPGMIQVKSQPIWLVPPGRYALALGIIDPGTNQPAIEFANLIETRRGWTILRSVEVITPP